MPSTTHIRSSATSFADIRYRLKETIGWFEERVGGSVAGSRLESISDKLSEIMIILEDSARRAQIFDLVDKTVAYYAWIDALGFIKIWETFKDLSDQLLPRSLLKRAIAGHLSPSDETVKDSDARNVFSQLEFAAHTARRGLKPRGFEDFEFIFEDCLFVAECKRLWSQSSQTVEDNARKIQKQLSTALSTRNHPVQRGLAVLTIDKIAGLADSLPMKTPVVGSSDVQQLSRSIVELFLDQYGQLFESLTTEISAAIIIPRFPVATLPEGAFGPVYIPTIKPLTAPDTKDHRRLIRLAKHLKDG